MKQPLTFWRAEDRHHASEKGPNPAQHRSHSLSEEPRTGIVSRVKIQPTTEATHKLKGQGQLSSAGLKSGSPWKPLTNWRGKDRCHQQDPNPAHHRSHSHSGEARTGIVSRVELQLTMEATHFLERQGQASSAGSKSSSPRKPLTSWRGKDRHHQQSKSSSPWKPLTFWRGEGRCHQQGPNPAHHRSHSLPGESRTGIISRVQIQLTMETTHILESQGQALSAGSKSSSPWKPLTPWRVEDRCRQQCPNPAHHRSHSLSEEPRTGVVSRVQIQLTTEATHILESQGQASSAGSKSSSPWKPLTFWRDKDRHHQQGPNPVHHRSHSHSGEARTSAVNRVKIQLTMETTHFLERQGQVLSAGSKSSSTWKPLTNWRGKDRHHQQGTNLAHHRSHSHSGEPRTSVISRVKIQLTTEATHSLESQGQASSAGSKSSSP